ncbi:FAD-dependent oxidoreductase [Catenulispora subtropica]|uniref:FAD-dependent oxidoreductase n=1 Tax=Catenulispora subtropica TaxID=450798 RepID=A0ABP5DPA1_9ACTN
MARTLASGAAAAPLLTGAENAAAAATALTGKPPAAPLPGSREEARDEARWQTCLGLARQLLLVGNENEDLKLTYLRTLIDHGLPRTTAPKRVLVVGAGISGLVAAWLLKAAGHHVTVLEANANRIGGRIKTFRVGPETSEPPFSDPAQYAEAGAMRIPSQHPLTLALVDKLKLKRRPFYNVDVVPGTGNPDGTPPPVTYKAFTGETWSNGTGPGGYRAPTQASNTWVLANGVRARKSEYGDHPAAMNRGFGVAESMLNTTTHAALDGILAPVYDYYSKREKDGTRTLKPFDQWVEGWARLLYDFDGFSMGRFLTEYARLGDGSLEAIGTIENLTSRLPLGFLHSFLDASDINPNVTYWELEGGTATLPYAMLPQVADTVVMNRRVIELEYFDPERASQAVHTDAKNRVWARTVQETGSDDVPGTEVPGSFHEFTADVAIVTIPFSALRHVTISPLMSYKKRRAVIELHYDAATKVLLEFNRRWWEFTEDDWKRELDARQPGLYDRYQARPGGVPAVHATGGGSVTDIPNRFVYHPSHRIGDSQGGVILASYSWADDALRWDSLDDEERYPHALRGLQQLYGTRIEAFFTGRGKTQSWLRNRYALGEAAVLTPNQLTQLHPAIGTPEGPLHFAGEHTSLKHAWIEGALESAVRTALEVNAA